MKKYFVANTVSGRIFAEAEGMTDDTIEGFGNRDIANSDLYVCDFDDGDRLDTQDRKWFDTTANTVVEKTDISLTYSHPAVSEDFFAQTVVPGITDPITGEAVTIGRGDILEEANKVLLNDHDIITVPTGTVVTISGIPDDGDTYIHVNSLPVAHTTSLEVTCPATVGIDSVKFYPLIIEVRP